MQVEDLQIMKVEAERVITDAMNAALEPFRQAGLAAKFTVSYVDMSCAEEPHPRLFHLAHVHVKL